MNTGSPPAGPGEQSMHRDEAGVWLSQDGTWQWDGANWVPRGANNEVLGDLIGFSKRDLDANAAGRLTFGQAAGLWLWAVIWLVLGTLLVGIALVSALPESFWLRVFVAPIVFTIAVYLCWRGFTAAADAWSGGVAFTSGALSRRWESDDDAPWGGAGYYYVGVSGVEKKVYKSVGERVPVGVYCRVYYSVTSKRLLSIDTAPSGDAQAFAPDSKTWSRIRWSWISAIVGIFVLVAGVSYVLAGDPTRRIDSSVAGVLLLLVAGILLGASIFRLVRTVRGGSAR